MDKFFGVPRPCQAELANTPTQGLTRWSNKKGGGDRAQLELTGALHHSMHSKKHCLILDWQKLEGMIYAESKFLFNKFLQAFLHPESYKPVLKRTHESHVFIDGRLELGVQWYSSLKQNSNHANFYQSNEKITLIHVIHNKLWQFVWVNKYLIYSFTQNKENWTIQLANNAFIHHNNWSSIKTQSGSHLFERRFVWGGFLHTTL